jgi:beta-phosphoglucomutase-like phosphatase (HAD superfamily)
MRMPSISEFNQIYNSLKNSEQLDSLFTSNNIVRNLDFIVSDDTVLFFDLDGTLVDTGYANFLSYKKAVEFVTESGCDIVYNPDKRFNRTALKNAIPNLTETELSEIISKKEKYYSDFLPETKLNKETSEILYKYSATNKIVLVTNSRKDRALATLNHHKLTDKFSDFFFRQFGENNEKINKFYNAILTLGVSPKLIIAFENEIEEIADAKKAGIRIINP